MASKDGTERDLDQTSTWAVAGVCAVIIVISIGLEKLLHKLGKVCSLLHLFLFFLFTFFQYLIHLFKQVHVLGSKFSSFLVWRNEYDVTLHDSIQSEVTSFHRFFGYLFYCFLTFSVDNISWYHRFIGFIYQIGILELP